MDEAAQGATEKQQMVSVADEAYRLHLRGMSYRAIGQQLGIDKNAVQRHIQAIEREVAPKRKETREAWLRRAIARFEQVELLAHKRFDETGEAQLLNTIATCEREIARLRGLYDLMVEGGESGGITIQITRRAIRHSSAEGASGE